MSRDGPMSFKELRERLTALSELQRDLRDTLESRLIKTSDSINTVARNADVPRRTLSDFRAERATVCSGKTLRSLCSFLDREELIPQIEELAAPIPDRKLGMGCFPKSVISLAVDLMEAQHDRADIATYAEFAESFDPYTAVITGVLQGSQEALEQLRDSKTHDDVLHTLLENLDERLEKILGRKHEAKKSAIIRLEGMIDLLLGRYGQKTAISRELGLSKTALREALSGRSGLEMIESISVKAEKLLAQPAPAIPDYRSLFMPMYDKLYERFGTQACLAEALGVPSSTLSYAASGKCSAATYSGLVRHAEKLLESPAPSLGAESVAEPAADKVAVTVTEAVAGSAPSEEHGLGAFASIGGITTDEGVPYVLTEESYQKLEGVPLLALRDSLITAIRLARLQLNIGSQLTSRTDRRILQDAVGRELKELKLAIDAFTFAHPNELLALHDSQRQFWAEQSTNSGQPRKGKP